MVSKGQGDTRTREKCKGRLGPVLPQHRLVYQDSKRDLCPRFTENKSDLKTETLRDNTEIARCQVAAGRWRRHCVPTNLAIVQGPSCDKDKKCKV